jgi:hypothetical protein
MMAMKAKTGEKLALVIEGVDDSRGIEITSQIQEFLKG